MTKNLITITERLTNLYCFEFIPILQDSIYWNGIQPFMTCAKLDQYIDQQHEYAYVLKILQMIFSPIISNLCCNYLLF